MTPGRPHRPRMLHVSTVAERAPTASLRGVSAMAQAPLAPTAPTGNAARTRGKCGFERETAQPRDRYGTQPRRPPGERRPSDLERVGFTLSSATCRAPRRPDQREPRRPGRTWPTSPDGVLGTAASSRDAQIGRAQSAAGGGATGEVVSGILTRCRRRTVAPRVGGESPRREGRGRQPARARVRCSRTGRAAGPTADTPRR
jgi:hypothetical protein